MTELDSVEKRLLACTALMILGAFSSGVIMDTHPAVSGLIKAFSVTPMGLLAMYYFGRLLERRETANDTPTPS